MAIMQVVDGQFAARASFFDNEEDRQKFNDFGYCEIVPDFLVDLLKVGEELQIDRGTILALAAEMCRYNELDWEKNFRIAKQLASGELELQRSIAAMKTA